MWFMMKKFVGIVVVVSATVMNSRYGMVVNAADFYVTGVNQKCIDEFNVVYTNAELAAASGTYSCPFTGGTCSVDLTGKDAQYIQVCRKIGGVPHEADIVLDCVGPTLVVTGLALTNAAYCIGASCTPNEAAALAGGYATYDLATVGQTCTGTANNVVPVPTSAAAPGLSLPFSSTSWMAWFGSTILLGATVMSIIWNE